MVVVDMDGIQHPVIKMDGEGTYPDKMIEGPNPVYLRVEIDGEITISNVMGFSYQFTDGVA